jgi:hypothetical protein
MTLSSDVVKSEIRTLYTIDMGGGDEVYAAAKVLQEAHYNAKFPGKDATELYFAISTSD